MADEHRGSIKKPLALQLEGHYNATWKHFVPVGSVKEDILAPSFWANVASKLRIGDEIKVLTEDMAWRALLIVRAVGRVEAVVQLLSYDDLGEASDVLSVADNPYLVEWGSPAVKFRVKRKDTGDVVKDMFQTREAAEQWVKSHLKLAA